MKNVTKHTRFFDGNGKAPAISSSATIKMLALSWNGGDVMMMVGQLLFSCSNENHVTFLVKLKAPFHPDADRRSPP